MVYDCVPFFNELDILKLRLGVMNPYVDRFIIEEASMTFSGEPKELCFEKNREMFAEYLDKITYIVVRDTPVKAVTHERDYFQKNRLIEGLKDAGPEDIIIFGDVDEIPNPEVLQDIIQNFDKEKVYHLAQRNFYAFLNMEERSGRLLSITGEFPDIALDKRKWLCTKICSISSIPPEGIVRLRDLVPPSDERSVRVPDGGWHFGYMGGHQEMNAARRIGVKVRAAAHQEYNDRELLMETMDRLTLGQDIFGSNARFDRVPVDASYPEYLRQHRSEYSYLIMKKITALDRFMAVIDLTAGRFVRRAWHHVLRRIGAEKD
jgi:beta-1,4-mannosyl-glycoprotein beta-1,4-N-acetylglucosaminyltransferase